jgi:hypothetical protein
VKVVPAGQIAPQAYVLLRVAGRGQPAAGARRTSIDFTHPYMEYLRAAWNVSTYDIRSVTPMGG